MRPRWHLRPAAPVLGLPCTPAACLPAERRRPCESPRAPMRWTAGCGWIGIGFAVRLGFGLESGCKFFSGPPYSITGRQAQLVSSSSSTSSTPKACVYHQKSMEGLQGGFMAPAAVGDAPAPPDPPLDPPLLAVTDSGRTEHQFVGHCLEVHQLPNWLMRWAIFSHINSHGS